MDDPLPVPGLSFTAMQRRAAAAKALQAVPTGTPVSLLLSNGAEIEGRFVKVEEWSVSIEDNEPVFLDAIFDVLVLTDDTE